MRPLNFMKTNLFILLAGLSGCPGFACPGAPSTQGDDDARWLIWGDFEDDISTYEIEVKGQRTKVVATYPKIRIATSTGVWQWSVEEVDVVDADCECVIDAFDEGRDVEEGECQTETTKQRGSFYELGSNRSWAPKVLGENDPDMEYSPSFEVTGSLDSKVFVTTCVVAHFCGAAHANTDCNSTSVDLETLKTHQLSDLVKPIADPSAMTFAFESDEVEDDVDLEEGVELVEIAVRATPKGATLDHRYVTLACVECGHGLCLNGDWTMASAVVEGQPIEGVLEPDASLEPALQRFIEDIGPNRVKGWSKLSGP